MVNHPEPLFPDKQRKRAPIRDEYSIMCFGKHHPGGALEMTIAEKVAIDFTDDEITSSGGSLFLSNLAVHLGLPDLLSQSIHLKVRRRGASDADTLLSLIYSLAQGDGLLSDVDRLGADHVRSDLLGLSQVPKSRRVSDYLAKFDPSTVVQLQRVARAVVSQLLPSIIDHEKERCGYIPVFVDGSAIEVYGDSMEGTGTGYSGDQQYWLHSVYVGRLWASGRLFPGGVDVASGWREQLDELTELLRHKEDIWVCMDNAYYRGEVVNYLREQDWDFSISVTNETYKRPLREEASYLWPGEWTAINDDGTEEAALIEHRPSQWSRKESYVVVRTLCDDDQKFLFPRYTFILVSRTDLPLAELVSRHRKKQGQENAQKGPLIDLDLHHPPCLRYEANRAFYTLGQIAQNLLMGIQYWFLPESARVHGIRPIIRDLVKTAARLVRHARVWTLKFAKTALRLDWINHAADRVEALARGPG